MSGFEEIWMFIAIGFAAQLVDGALGMAYGVTASSLLLGLGVPPAVSSATVHAAECFSTGASAASHRALGNVDRELFRKLILPAIVGAGLGAYVLSWLPGDALKPWIAAYLLLMGVVIIYKAVRKQVQSKPHSNVGVLGFFGALIDAIGGGGWGPIVVSNLMARGADFRFTVGSANAVEFFVTLTASAVFLITVGLSHWQIILGLAIGGVLAAPLGAWLVKHAPRKPMQILVGVLIIVLSLRTGWKHFA